MMVINTQLYSGTILQNGQRFFLRPTKLLSPLQKLRVEKVISRHGVPVELLSDKGSAFLNHPLQVGQLLWICRVQYHCLPPAD